MSILSLFWAISTAASHIASSVIWIALAYAVSRSRILVIGGKWPYLEVRNDD